MASSGVTCADQQFDVIIVGGRPAGSTLAARLGRQGLRVLIVERATLPSPPAVSCPVIYSSTMSLLDEIGADEAEYAQDTPRLRRWTTDVRDDFSTINMVPLVRGRDYAYAIDRARFDGALWQHARREPAVVAIDGFTVTDLLWNDGRVAGIRGRRGRGAEQTFAADCVVGADGRFSTVARKAGASSYDEHDAHPTSIYYAYWKDVAPYDDHGTCVQVFAPGEGFGFLLAESAGGMTMVAIEGRTGLLDPGEGKPGEMYARLVQQYPRVWRRLQDATQATGVHGMRKIGNLYRQAGGPGWALVGDALHQKDPLDGQGIYDAVFTARALAEAIGAWKRGEQTWEQALAGYEAAVRTETYPMYRRTIERVRTEVYGRIPRIGFNTYLRWLMQDREYKRRIGLLVVRDLHPEGWLPLHVMLRAMLGGALADLGRACSTGLETAMDATGWSMKLMPKRSRP